MKGIEFNTEDSCCIFYINENIYPIDVVMKTSYIFIENFYIFFDYEQEHVIIVSFKSKNGASKEEMSGYIGEFFNEMLNQLIRVDIFNKTKNIRQIILARALYGNCIDTSELDKNVDCQSNTSLDEINLTKYENSEDDCLRIASNWFENH